MIKYHPTIVGWLIKENKVDKQDDKLVVHKRKKETIKYIRNFKGEVYLTNSDGSKRISSNYSWNNRNFTQINLLHKDIQYLVRDGFQIFDIGNRCERHCLTSQLEKLLIKHYNILGDISFPKDYPRLKGESALCFIKWIENKHEYIINNEYKFGKLSKWGYLGLSGFSDSQPEVIDNIKRYGIFAYEPIYDRIEWTFKLVEKYKDQIHWLSLMNLSNLVWNEEKLRKYAKYIPFTTDKDTSYSDKFFSGLKAYDKFGFLSNEYLEDNKDVLDWREILRLGKFKWNKDEISYFCNYILNIDLPYSTDDWIQPTSMKEEMPYYIGLLLSNKNFKWNKNNLESFLNISEKFWDKLTEYPDLFNVFLSISDVHKKAEGKITKNNFWEIVEYNHDFPYEELSKDFNICNIKKNIKKWSEPIQNKFLHTERTPDTNYSYYWVRTKWDDMCNNVNIPINYELAVYLRDLEITIGGTYCESDGGTIEEDHRWPKVNALRWCSNHHVENKEEIEKIIDDQSLLEVLLNPDNSINSDIVTYMCNEFFKSTTIQQYLDIINNLKDWDNVVKIE